MRPKVKRNTEANTKTNLNSSKTNHMHENIKEEDPTIQSTNKEIPLSRKNKYSNDILSNSEQVTKSKSIFTYIRSLIKPNKIDNSERQSDNTRVHDTPSLSEDDLSSQNSEDLAKSEPRTNEEILKLKKLFYLQNRDSIKENVLRINESLNMKEIANNEGCVLMENLIDQCIKNQRRNIHQFINITSFIYEINFQNKYLNELFGYTLKKPSSLFEKIFAYFFDNKAHVFNKHIFEVLKELNTRNFEEPKIDLKRYKYKKVLKRLKSGQRLNDINTQSSDYLYNIILMYCKDCLDGIIQYPFYLYYEFIYLNGNLREFEILKDHISLIVNPVRLDLITKLLQYFSPESFILKNVMMSILISRDCSIKSKDAYLSLINLLKEKKYKIITII